MPSLIPFEIPPGLVAFAAREAEAAWLDALPRLVRDTVEGWELDYDGAPLHGSGALVVPVRTAAGRPAVLKVAWPHDEEEHEHLGLQALQGDGTVELYRADPRRHVLLLERLHAGQDLTTVEELAACEIAASLYQRIHIPALPQLRTLTSYVVRWTAGLERLPRDAPVPRRLVEQAISLGRSFAGDEASVGTMIHGDLHYENVLAADREPWLVIDPKPMSGDPHYEVAPLLWNRWGEVVRSGDARNAVRSRFHATVDTAGLDEERARDWVVVRGMHNALWTLQDAERAGSPLTPEDRDRITRAVTVAKAVQA